MKWVVYVWIITSKIGSTSLATGVPLGTCKTWEVYDLKMFKSKEDAESFYRDFVIPAQLMGDSSLQTLTEIVRIGMEIE